LKKTFVSLLIGSLLFSSCQKEAQLMEMVAKPACLPQTEDPTTRSYTCDDIVAVSNPGNHCGFLPLSTKSYWVYQDSIFDNGAFVKVQFDTLRFQKAWQTTPDNLTWWESNIEVGLPRLLYANEHGIYQLEIRFFADCIWDAHKEFILPAGDSAKYLSHFEDNAAFGRAVKLTGSFKTPAGSFSDCILFEKDAKFYRKDQVYFKPGIGVVKYRLEKAPMVNPIVSLQKISTLVTFSLQ
jgi:hypothetical protein